MTDNTQPEAGSTHIIRFALELGLLWIDGSGRDKVREALDALDALEAQLEAIGAGGVSGPLMGRASLAANAGEPVAWQYRSLRDNGAWFDCTKERFEMRCTQPEIWETRALYAAPPTAQAEGWRTIETAPRDGTEVLADTSGLGRVVVYWDDEESQWGTGLGYLDRGAPTHWMPLPPPPTSAEGVEHG